MAKATVLNAAMLDEEAEATHTRSVVKNTKKGKEKEDITPLQIRVTTEDRFAIKVDAAKLHFRSETAFMLECWRYYMKNHDRVVKQG